MAADRWNYRRPNYSLMWPTIVFPYCYPFNYFCGENFLTFFNEIKLLLTHLLKFWWIKLFWCRIKRLPEFKCAPCWIWLIVVENAIAALCDFAWMQEKSVVTDTASSFKSQNNEVSKFNHFDMGLSVSVFFLCASAHSKYASTTKPLQMWCNEISYASFI